MGLSAEAIVAIIGVAVALPTTIIVLWNFIRPARIQRLSPALKSAIVEWLMLLSVNQDLAEGLPELVHDYIVRGQINIHLQRAPGGHHGRG